MVDISINVGQNNTNGGAQPVNNSFGAEQNPVFSLLPPAPASHATSSKVSPDGLTIDISHSNQQPRFVPIDAPECKQNPNSNKKVELSKSYNHAINSAAKLRKTQHLDGRIERKDDGRNRMKILLSTLANKGPDEVATIAKYWPVNASSMFDKVANQAESIDDEALEAYADKHPIFAKDDLKTLFDTTFDVDGDGTTTRDEFAQVSETGKALAGKKRQAQKPAYFD